MADSKTPRIQITDQSSNVLLEVLLIEYKSRGFPEPKPNFPLDLKSPHGKNEERLKALLEPYIKGDESALNGLVDWILVCFLSDVVKIAQIHIGENNKYVLKVCK